jgi:hypothetical protein
LRSNAAANRSATSPCKAGLKRRILWSAGFWFEWHCRLSGLKLRRVAGEQFGAGLFARLHQ